MTTMEMQSTRSTSGITPQTPGMASSEEPSGAVGVDGDHGIWSVLAGMDPVYHRSQRCRRHVDGTVYRKHPAT